MEAARGKLRVESSLDLGRGGQWSPLKYLEAVRGVLSHLETVSLDAIDQAAGIVVESITNGGSSSVPE